MTRAGQEPAQDVKRRIIHACQEVGLKVISVKARLLTDNAVRFVLVDASPPGWSDESPLIEVLAFITVGGQWSGNVRIFCAAYEGELMTQMWQAPNMRGRDSVPLGNLVTELQKTLEEREQVVAARKLGIDGPYEFEDSRWEKPRDILKL